MYDPVASARWKKDALMLLAFRPRRKMLTGAVGVAVVEVFKRPPKDRDLRLAWHVKKPDVDNVTKLVLDTLEAAKVFRNDCLVVQLGATKLLAPAGVFGQVLIHIDPEPRLSLPMGLAWPTCNCWLDEQEALKP